MRPPTCSLCRSLILLLGLFLLVSEPLALAAEPSPAALSAFAQYSAAVETRLAQQHRADGTFLAAPSGPEAQARLFRGELLVEQLMPLEGAAPAGALLHHWRGTAFAPGATVADFERLLRDVNGYPRLFAPEVLQARVLAGTDDHLETFLRVRQQHVLTVVLDATYDVRFGRLDPQHGDSISRSTRIAEIGSVGTSAEHALSPEDEHGFLWRTNTYWSYEERDGGLYVQLESLSLTRNVPRGLGWAVGPYLQSIPRESLAFTLRAVCKGLRRPGR